MIASLLDGWEFVDLGPDGGPYDEVTHPKIGLHTWEGYSWAAAETAFAKYPPHCAVNWKDRRKRQYVRLDRHAYAFAGGESDDECIFQLEIAGYADRWAEVPDDALLWIGGCIRELMAATGTPYAVPRQGFHGGGEGIVLATASSPIRFKSEAALRAFSGLVGHQHVPAPDTHYDPGRIPLDRMGFNGAAAAATTTGGLHLDADVKQRFDDIDTNIKRLLAMKFDDDSFARTLTNSVIATVLAQQDPATFAAAVAEHLDGATADEVEAALRKVFADAGTKD